MTHRTNTGYSLLFTISEERGGETVQPPKNFQGEFKIIQLAGGRKGFFYKDCGDYTVLVEGPYQVRFFK